MEVTEVRVFLADEDDERLKAYATVTFDNCFVVRDLKIINGNNGLFVAMPSKKRKDGTYKDIAHPIHSDFRQSLEQIILAKYNDETTGAAVVGTTSEKPRPIDVDSATLDGAVIAETVLSHGTVREFEAGIGPAVAKK